MSLADPHYFTVAEDIRHLQRTWDRGAPDEQLRRDSPILRRFLVDGGQGILVHAWREYDFSGQPTIVAPDLMSGTGGELSLVALAVAGGGNVDGTYVANLALYKSSTVPEPLEVEHGTSAEREWKLLDFVDAPSIIVNEEPVSRREVVKYAANYLGGVHLAPNVRKAEEEMVERIHKIRGTLNNASRAGLIPVGFAFELLSIGQLVSSADDINRLATAIEKRRKAM